MGNGVYSGAMKIVRISIITYTIFMLAVLAVMLLKLNGTDLKMVNVGSYSVEEMETYKKAWDNFNQSFTDGKEEILKLCLIFWAVVLVGGYILIIAVYITQIKPVNELESYASEIAKGNLDVQLPMHRNNMFGNFTESFDIMREELKTAKEKEIEADNNKREFVAELSHDLKTPIATIQATCEVMEVKYKDNPDIQEKVGYIFEKSEMINTLLGNVFHAALEDMDEIKVEPVMCDSKEIERYFGSLKDYGNIILENHIPECLVSIDKMRMQQVIDNIVGNSYKYAGTDINVRFDEAESIKTSEKEISRFLRIKIKDFGPGVPEEELPLIVEKYYRGSNQTEKQGYGLGMYLVKTYMDRMGGGMEYYNENGFVVELLVRIV